MARSTVQRIGDVETMVTSFQRTCGLRTRHRPTIQAYSYAPTQLAGFLRDRGMPVEVANIKRDRISGDTRRGWARAMTLDRMMTFDEDVEIREHLAALGSAALAELKRILEEKDSTNRTEVLKALVAQPAYADLATFGRDGGASRPQLPELRLQFPDLTP